MNAGTSVQKELSPEESAIIANISGLITQLQSGGNPHAEPDLDNNGGLSDNDADNNPGVMKGSEQGTTPDEPQSVMQPNAGPKNKGMANWEDNEEVKKAFATIAKSIETSTSDSATANDSGEERAEEIPDIDEENVKEVAKALLAMAGKKKVAKSADLSPVMEVMKSMAERIDQQGQIIGEMLSGFQAASGVAPAPTAVQKSQNAPYQGGNMVDVIAASVTKSLKDSGVYRGDDSGIPVAKGFHRTVQDNGEAIRGFSEGIANDPMFKEKWNL